MSIVAKPLVEAQFAAASATLVYTAPGGTNTIIDKCLFVNTDSSARTVTVNIVANGGSVASSNTVVNAVSLAAGASYDCTEMKNQILGTGSQIYISASVASKVVMRISGREIA